MLAAIVWCAATSPVQAERFIAFSDIHLDPTADPALVPDLVAADAAAWGTVLERGNAGMGAFGRDATWALVRSALDRMRAVEPDPAFLMMTGDLLAHDFRAKFAAAMPGADDATYDAFVVKTVRFLGAEIMARFPGKRVFLALGNNDDFCGDYMLTPDGAFLADSEPTAQALLGLEDRSGFARQWELGYGYDLPNGSIPGLRMVFLNSVFLSPGYDEACGRGAPTDPGLAAMDWLAGRLAAAAARGEKVWLFMHIPPGGDPYATLRHGACAGSMVAMWTAPETERFLDLVRRHAGTVTAIFAGHTHMDEFRLLGDPARPDGFVLVTPGISPVFGQNPAFHVYDADRSGRLVDRTTWILADLGTAGGPAWRREYRFGERWGVTGLDGGTLAAVAGRIAADPAAQAIWYSVYPAGRTAMWKAGAAADSLPPATFAAYRCAITSVAPDAYRACVCGG